LFFLREEIPKDKGTLLKLFLLGVINALGVICTTIALVTETSGISAILTYTQPLFVFFLSVLFLRSEIHLVRLLGAFVGFFGVTLLATSRSELFHVIPFSSGLLLLGAFLWAVTIVYYKRALSDVNYVVTTMFQLVVGSLFLVPLASVSEGLSLPLTLAYILMIGYLSVFATGIGLLLWIRLMREEDVTVLSSSGFAVPVVALLLGWMLLGERVDLGLLPAILLIVLGVYLVNRPTSLPQAQNR
jgi:drug/metabolite transporter (DMT)-like permease